MMSLAQALIHQRDHRIEGNAYKLIQCDFAYNSNHMEGSTLTHEQTVTVYERDAIEGPARIDDVIEARNHFELLDLVLDRVDDPLSTDLVREMHAALKRGTSAERDPYQVVGDFKAFENVIADEVSPVATAAPEDVPGLVSDLFDDYEGGEYDFAKGPRAMAAFHVRFERIHPFSDGNGRIGRMLLFKEVLRQGVIPPLVREEVRSFYLQGLREFDSEPGYLTDTLGWCQDDFEVRYMPLVERYAADVERFDARMSEPERRHADGAER